MMWGIGSYNIGITTDPMMALSWWKIAYIGVIFIPTILIHFVYVFLEKKKTFFIPSLYFISALYLYANIFTDRFISDTHFIFNQLHYLSPNYLYNSFVVFFATIVIYAHVLLFSEYRKAVGLRKRQIQYFFLGTFVGFLGGSFSFIPVYSINIYPYLNNLVFLFPVFMGYAVIRHNLANIKVVATESFVFILWFFLAIRALIPHTGDWDKVMDIALLLVSFVAGVFLIRSVFKEVRDKEEIELLAHRLKRTNIDLEEQKKELEQAQRKEAMKAKEVLRLKDEFVFLATHELRTPITAIRGFLELTEEAKKKFPKDIKRNFDAISDASEYLNQLINNLLGIARSDSGALKVNVKTHKFEPILQEILDEVAPLVKEKNIKLNINVDKTLVVCSDPIKLKEILMNLISNAIKYNRDNGFININAYLSHGKKLFIFEIQDNGYGIHKDQQDKIFQKFFRASTKGTQDVLGTGLGLFITRMLIEKMGGSVSFSSVEQKGTTFTFTLPISV